jgi:uncharacterized delta-60 repeat protein
MRKILLVFLLITFHYTKSQTVSLVPQFGGKGYTITNIENINGLGGGTVIKLLPLSGDYVLAVTQNTQVTSIIKISPIGTFDNSFGVNGIATVNNFNATSAVLQADGKILIAGTNSGLKGMSAIARVNSNGTVDSSFGQIGRISFLMSVNGSSIADIALQNNGNIIVCGTASTSTTTTVTKFGVARITNTGVLDNSFDSDGIAVLNIANSTLESPSCLAVLSDGSIAVAGYTFPGPGVRSLTVAKLTNTGILDASFDTDGIILDAFSNNAYALDIQIQTDNKIVVGGSSYVGTEFVSYLIRYNSNGTKDISFDNDGILFMPFPTAGTYGGSYLKELIIAGSSIYCMHDVNSLPGNNGFAITKHTTTGAFDNSFNANGIIQSNFDPGNFDEGLCFGLSAEGKVYAGGRASTPFSLDFLGINKFNANGTADNSFDTDGKLVFNIQASEDVLNDIIRQPDGKILAVGTTRKVLASPATSFVQQNGLAMIRYKPNGTLDSTFGINGIVAEYTITNSVLANAVSLQADGKIVITGQSKAGGLGIARYNANGTIDNTFGTNGRTSILNIPIFTSNDQLGPGNDIVILPNGKILVAGYASTISLNQYHNNLVVIRFNADGTKDNTFGTLGQATGTGSTYSSEVGYALAVQTDGKIVAVGNSDRNFYAIRFTDAGVPDPTFNTTTKQSVSFGNNEATARAVYVQADGRIILAGNAYGDASLEHNDLAMLRFMQDGTLDAGFGISGLVKTNLGFEDEGIKALGMQTDGSIIVAATGRSNIDNYNFMLAKYNSSGVINTTFNNGLVNKDFVNGAREYLNSAYMIGGIVYVGGYIETSKGKDFLVAAYDFTTNPLPLNFLTFSAQKCNNTNVCLTWKTSNEQNVSHFEIERSTDAVNYNVIGTVNAGGNYYSYQDNQPNWSNKNLYYRIKQIDRDGRNKRSNIIWLKDESKGVQLYPTLVINNFTVQNNTTEKLWLQLTNATGKTVLQQQITAGTNFINANMLTKGVYFYSIKNGVQQTAFGKLVKQ